MLKLIHIIYIYFIKNKKLKYIIYLKNLAVRFTINNPFIKNQINIKNK